MNSKTRLSRIQNQTKWVVIANGEPVSFGLEDWIEKKSIRRMRNARMKLSMCSVEGAVHRRAEEDLVLTEINIHTLQHFFSTPTAKGASALMTAITVQTK
jgi:hypothetical protein